MVEIIVQTNDSLVQSLQIFQLEICSFEDMETWNLQMSPGLLLEVKPITAIVDSKTTG